MNRRLFTAGAAIALLLTAGCATVPPLPPNPADQDPAAGTIVFYRPMSGFGYGIRPDIFVDGVLVGRSVPGEQFMARAIPGTRIVSVPGHGPFGAAQRVDVVVRTGASVYVRTSMGGASFVGRTDVELVDAKTAEGEILTIGTVRR